MNFLSDLLVVIHVCAIDNILVGSYCGLGCMRIEKQNEFSLEANQEIGFVWAPAKAANVELVLEKPLNYFEILSLHLSQAETAANKH